MEKLLYDLKSVVSGNQTLKRQDFENFQLSVKCCQSFLDLMSPLVYLSIIFELYKLMNNQVNSFDFFLMTGIIEYFFYLTCQSVTRFNCFCIFKIANCSLGIYMLMINESLLMKIIGVCAINLVTITFLSFSVASRSVKNLFLLVYISLQLLSFNTIFTVDQLFECCVSIVNYIGQVYNLYYLFDSYMNSIFE